MVEKFQISKAIVLGMVLPCVLFFLTEDNDRLNELTAVDILPTGILPVKNTGKGGKGK